ncbi:MAG: DUF1353 domain-containing protein [Nocardioides sp.]|nr:DUF1353 domain-containing protein [Nocardioides sp.]
MSVLLAKDTRRFYDGGVPAREGAPAEPPDPGENPQIVLERHAEEGEEQFAMVRRIAYRDRRFGQLLVPADPESFRTDLTSVPAILTWLVPKTGAHLPAALLHDGLVHGAHEAPTYISSRGFVLDRVEADRVFRDAMVDTGTRVVRRWLVWSAVTAVTLLRDGGAGWSPSRRWRYRLAVVGTLLIVALLGAVASLDLFDVAGPSLPWMGERSWWQELVGGLSGAVVIPLLLGLTWGRFRIAGCVMGVGLAVLLHVTIAVLTVTWAYRLVERLASRTPFVAAGLGVAAVVAAAAVLLGRLVGGV